jgi:hypothetical protein
MRFDVGHDSRACTAPGRVAGAAITALALVALVAWPAAQTRPPAPPLDVFGGTTAASERDARAALDVLARNWHDSYASIVLELAEMVRPTQPAPPIPDDFPPAQLDPSDDTQDPRRGRDGGGPPPPRLISPVRERLLRFLERQTGKRFGNDFDRWHQWVWSLPYEPHPDYLLFKGLLYANIDPRMREFFAPGAPAIIRLDEIEWGGVTVNGIPPLYYPSRLTAAAADYLQDDHVVFGIAINGEARAYPKRILAWHELAWDRVGEVELTIVYCTLCGTVIPYESVIDGQRYRLGTSGLLYRSNKLMFDEETKSLWSTLEGKPVVGALVGSGLELRPRAVVTTTWGEWRRAHPDTTVLSLDTGHERDYAEGAAYREYFATDRLMFNVPTTDRRLKNKDEVLVMRVPPAGGGDAVPVAMAADFLKRRPVFQTDVAGRQVVVVTSRNGANRAYDAGTSRFQPVRNAPDVVVDELKNRWRVTEAALVNETDGRQQKPRLASQRAFWFGWHAQYPETILIK